MPDVHKVLILLNTVYQCLHWSFSTIRDGCIDGTDGSLLYAVFSAFFTAQ